MCGLSNLCRSWVVQALLILMGALAALNLGGAIAHAAVQAAPELSSRVLDQTGTLSADELASLKAQIEQLERDTGAQLAVLMVSSTAPEDIFAYSNRVANTWKLGRAGVGDGLLIVVAKDDRRMRIEVAKALEGAVTDIQAGRIVNEWMAPAFRRDDHAGGLTQAVQALSTLVRGEALPAPPVSDDSRDMRSFLWLAPTSLLGFLLFGLLPRAWLAYRWRLLLGVAGAFAGMWWVTGKWPLAAAATVMVAFPIGATVLALVRAAHLPKRPWTPPAPGSWRPARTDGTGAAQGAGAASNAGGSRSSSSGGGGSGGGSSSNSGGGGSFGGGGASGHW